MPPFTKFCLKHVECQVHHSYFKATWLHQIMITTTKYCMRCRINVTAHDASSSPRAPVLNILQNRTGNKIYIKHCKILKILKIGTYYLLLTLYHAIGDNVVLDVLFAHFNRLVTHWHWPFYIWLRPWSCVLLLVQARPRIKMGYEWWERGLVVAIAQDRGLQALVFCLVY